MKSLPASAILRDAPVQTLHAPHTSLWNISRVSNDGSHLIGVGVSPASPEHARFIAWDLASDAHPIVAELDVPLHFATQAMGLTNAAERLHRPGWAADVADDRLTLHVPEKWAALAGVSRVNPPAGVSIIPDETAVRSFTSLESAGLPGQLHSEPLYRAVQRKQSKSDFGRLSFLAPLAHRQASVPAEPVYAYAWAKIGPTLKLSGSEQYAGLLSRDQQTFVISVNDVQRAELQWTHPIDRRVVIWEIPTRSVRHEYLVEVGTEEDTRHVMYPLGSSPDGTWAVFRSEPDRNWRVRAQTGLFFARTSAPWTAVFIEPGWLDGPTPGPIVHDVAWREDNSPILVLSGAGEGDPPRLVRADLSGLILRGTQPQP